MKYIWVLALFFSLNVYSQTYHLLPDTCTYCSYLYSTNGNNLQQGTYPVDPEIDTFLMGQNYLVIPSTAETYSGFSITGVRQVGNKVLGISADNQNQTYLIQDWDAEVGDTLFNLYSNRTFYDALFLSEDSIVLNDGSYHHIRQMKGIAYYPNGQMQATTWTFYWQERGLCGEHETPYFAIAGGLTYNLPDYTYGGPFVAYYLPQAHTADTRYNKSNFMDGCDFVYSLQDLTENAKDPFIFYPNPSAGIVYFSGQTMQSARIWDAKGVEMERYDDEISEIDLTHFKNGIYFIQCTNVFGESFIRKIVKVD